MEPVALVFLAAAYGALVASYRGGRASAHLLAWLMMAALLVTNVLWSFAAMDLIALVDLPIAMLAYTAASGSSSAWKRVVVAAYVGRLLLHVLFSCGTIDFAVYAHTCNAAFLAALIAVSWNGGISDVIGWLGRLCRLCVGVAKGPPSLVSRLTL